MKRPKYDIRVPFHRLIHTYRHIINLHRRWIESCVITDRREKKNEIESTRWSYIDRVVCVCVRRTYRNAGARAGSDSSWRRAEARAWACCWPTWCRVPGRCPTGLPARWTAPRSPCRRLGHRDFCIIHSLFGREKMKAQVLGGVADAGMNMRGISSTTNYIFEASVALHVHFFICRYDNNTQLGFSPC